MPASRCARRRTPTHCWSLARISARSCSSPERGPASRLRDDLPLPQRGDDALGNFLRGALAGIDDDLRVLRRLIRGVDAGEVLDLAFEGAGVETFRVALLADIERRVDVDLDELAVADQLAHHAPLGAEG